MSKEETENAFAKACAKLTSDEMAVMVRRALAVYQASVESKPKMQKVELPPIDMRLEGKDLEGYLNEEESRIRLQASAAELPGVKLALAVSNSGHTGNTGFRGEPRRCYRCGEIGHLKQACPKPPNERETGGRGQSGSHDRGRGGRRIGRGGNRTHLMVAEKEEAGGDLTEEDQALVEAYSQGLRDRQKLMGDVKSMRDDASTSTGSRGNFAYFAQTATGTHDTRALVSISTTRSPDWIVDSGASRHVTGTVGEFSSYTRLAVPESVQIADGSAQAVVGKGTVRCTDSVTLTNVLHAPSFPVNLVSISAIIREQKCIVIFDIPRMVFQEKGTGRVLGTGTWRDGLWYMDRDGMDTALASVVDRVGVGGSGMSVEDELRLIHRRMRHSSFSLL